MNGSAYIRDPAHVPDTTSVRPRRDRTPDDYATALLGLLEHLDRRAVTCAACGCLCLSDEVCPGCRAARIPAPTRGTAA